MLEVLVAAGITLLASSIVASAVMGPMRALTEAAAPDEERAALEAASDVFARVVRGARPGLTRAALLHASDDEVVLRLQRDGLASVVRLALVGDALTLGAAEGVTPSDLPSGVLVDGLQRPGSRFLLLDRDGSEVGPGDLHAVRAIGLVLESPQHRVLRIGSLRVHDPHRGPRAW
jgi:hypothetical protein